MHPRTNAPMEIRPFSWMTGRAQNRVLVILTVLLVGCSAWLMWMDRALVSAAAPHGIVSFELARTLENSTRILHSWSREAQLTAMLVQGFDYLYLLVYPAWFSMVAVRLGALLGGVWGLFGLPLSRVVLLAAPLDAVENYALVQQLLHGAAAHHASLAWWCAVPKFALVAGALAFVLIAGGAGLTRRLRGG